MIGRIKIAWLSAKEQMVARLRHKERMYEKELNGQNRGWLLRELDEDMTALEDTFNASEDFIDELMQKIGTQELEMYVERNKCIWMRERLERMAGYLNECGKSEEVSKILADHKAPEILMSYS